MANRISDCECEESKKSCRTLAASPSATTLTRVRNIQKSFNAPETVRAAFHRGVDRPCQVAADRLSASEALQYLQDNADADKDKSAPSGEVMPTSNDSLRTNASSSETPEIQMTPGTANPSVDRSQDKLSLEQWTQNGLRRLNDQVTPFPRVF